MMHLLLRTPPQRRPIVRIEPGKNVTAWTVAAALAGSLAILGAIFAAASVWAG
jgi:hypothetical protein